MAGTETPLTVKCPRCNKPVSWTDKFPFKPFCCERCKLIDLGEWAAEEKIIPGEPAAGENNNDDPPFYQ